MRIVQDDSPVKCRSNYLRRDFTRHVRQKEWPQEIDSGSHIRLRQRGHSKTLSTNSRVVWSELSSEFVSGVGELSSVEHCGSAIAETLLEIPSMPRNFVARLHHIVHRKAEFRSSSFVNQM
jgi:hypothetical protein